MTIRYEQGADGVVVLTLDDPSRGANTMNQAFLTSLDATVTRLEAEKAGVTGVIITSAKRTWFAGGDLDALSSFGADQAAEAYQASVWVKERLRRLETLGRPVVAAINGTVLGGGLELALACHHRIVADDRRIEIGFPEVTLGLLPAGCVMPLDEEVTGRIEAA